MELGGRRWDADAAGRHLAGAVHSQFVHDAGAGPQIGGEPFHQARDVEEDVPSAIIRPQEAEALGFEIGHHRAGLFARWRFGGRLPGLRGGLRGPADLIADALLDQGQVGFRPIGRMAVSSVGILRSGLRFRASSNIRF